ncbi:NAD-dependent epimerase/dehydratase family protein [Actinospongicola halichondriae]|uniref:NAD-dependent epimerase/dehydratase family protein n=1 Tax=Actinospongicola halichondriae TaxID=3236844 RepID=UPI003D3941D7
MKILVTGGAGFIGSSLVDRILAGGHHVDIVDDLRSGTLGNLAGARAEASGRLKIHQLDVRDDSLCDLLVHRRPEIVYHLATNTDRSGSLSNSASASIDVAGTVQVLEAALAAGTDKVVLAGSARARSGRSARHTTRAMVDDLAVRYRELHGLEHTIVVLPTVFGPRQRPGRESAVVATFAERLVRGQPCVVHGSGEQSRDLLYVDDAVDALVKAATAADGLSVDVGTGRQTSIASLHGAMAAMVGRDDELVPGAERADEPGVVPVDPARAELYLGWKAFTPLAEGLTDAVVALDR